ncbi:hypothetical protein C8R46DRAFT_1287102 [Mycena filopes]|nr:hypothetical protein C8R46DRAFT_1287102 [Mycena filopes]
MAEDGENREIDGKSQKGNSCHSSCPSPPSSCSPSRAMSSTTTTTTTTMSKPRTAAYTPSPSLAMATAPLPATPSTSTSTNSTSAAIPSTTTENDTPTRGARVRFDASCVLIPSGSLDGASKRPRMVTKSYSLPLWKKSSQKSSSHSRDREEDAERGHHEHVVLKVALPSFKSSSTSFRKPSAPSSHNSHSPSRGRNASRSPPPIGSPVLASCLRLRATSTPTSPPSARGPGLTINTNTTPSSSDTLHPHVPLIALAAVVVDVPPPSPSTSSTSPSSSPTLSPRIPSSSRKADPEPQLRVVPLRACCPECALRADVPEEAFSRGALRVRRRGGFGALNSPARHGTTYGFATEGSLMMAARAGGLLDSPAPGGGFHGHGQAADEGSALMHGSGIAEVTRLVAELERRRSATPSPAPTPPISPTAQQHGGSGGRLSPSLLGPALARIVDGPQYGDRLTPTGSVHGSRNASGRASPLLPLGIAVDEVDKERRRMSLGLGGVPGEYDAGVVFLGEEADGESDEADHHDGAWQRIGLKPPRTPSPRISFDSAAAASTDSPRSAVSTASTAFSSSRSPSGNAPVRAYADDDDADLFPLPSSSSASGKTTPRSTPRGSPRGSPSASASDVNLGQGAGARLAVVAGGSKAAKRVSAGGSPLLPAALANARGAGAREGTPPPSPALSARGNAYAEERERVQRETSEREQRERSRSEAVCVALGSHGRREREEREQREKERERLREVEREQERQRERERGHQRERTDSTAAKCARGLLLPPGDERECDWPAREGSAEHLHSREGSRERERVPSGSSASASASDGEERDLERPLPVLPRLATSVLAAGPYSPALAPRSNHADGPSSSASPPTKASSSHLRVASAPAASPSSSPSGSTATVARSASPSTTTRAKSASTSTSVAPTLSTSRSSPLPHPRNASQPPSSARAAVSASQPSLRRASSFARLRSSSSASGKDKDKAASTGRKAFGAFVDVLKGVTSISGGV